MVCFIRGSDDDMDSGSEEHLGAFRRRVGECWAGGAKMGGPRSLADRTMSLKQRRDVTEAHDTYMRTCACKPVRVVTTLGTSQTPYALAHTQLVNAKEISFGPVEKSKFQDGKTARLWPGG
ncbi:hypothetical protein SUNI508_07094 [Seiridium unicorne]|uniref:Uncharacterized protein n=1 Tax=Seiridium unicorne TaxID=138068 RepID=A0ABR2UYT9_9PEZI